MKLHDNQIKLIQHLARFNLLDYENCLKLLDTAGTGDRVALSYAFRPLTKNGYLVKRKDGVVSITKKGRGLFPAVGPLISSGGGSTSVQRVVQVSRVAMLMEENGISCTGRLRKWAEPYFIPSACWRKIATGILSTTRFAGMLIMGREKFAVYDIGDGHVEWQVRAEGSLFYWHYGQMETRADGMIFLCRDEYRTEVAQNIIRQTMWNRKQLLSETSETSKPVRWSRSPIKLRAQYDHVYLMTYGDFGVSLSYLRWDEPGIYRWPERAQDLYNPAHGDYEIETDRRYRYFRNPATDLLKYVYFFAAAKRLMRNLEEDNPTYGLNYALRCRKRDFPILRMYPDVVKSERVKIYKYQDQ